MNHRKAQKGILSVQPARIRPHRLVDGGDGDHLTSELEYLRPLDAPAPESDAGPLCRPEPGVVYEAHNSITTCPPGHIMIGGRAVPEPMREVPPDGKTIYLVSTGSPALISSWRWYGNDGDKDRLRSGLIHSSEASARAHAEAIIALSAGEGV